MTYDEVLKNARENIGPYCKACPVCNGIACRNAMPGPGAKGLGTGFIRSYDAWQKILLNLDTIYEGGDIDTKYEAFGKSFDLPVFAGPVGAMNLHYGEKYNDMQYTALLVPGAIKAGIAAFTGDGAIPEVYPSAIEAVKASGGLGIPTIKPWDMDTVFQRIDLGKTANPFAFAMDIDAAGLPHLQGRIPPAGSKTVEQLAEIVKYAEKPFIIKGVMTAKGAEKALKSGAAGIVVSNHGGRVLDQCPATAEVLPEIVKAVGGQMKIFIDGGIRTGLDVFKALAMGADGVLIARPFVTAVYGGGEEGVAVLVNKIKAELMDAMRMCGARSLAEISSDMVRY